MRRPAAAFQPGDRSALLVDRDEHVPALAADGGGHRLDPVGVGTERQHSAGAGTDEGAEVVDVVRASPDQQHRGRQPVESIGPAHTAIIAGPPAPGHQRRDTPSQGTRRPSTPRFGTMPGC